MIDFKICKKNTKQQHVILTYVHTNHMTSLIFCQKMYKQTLSQMSSYLFIIFISFWKTQFKVDQRTITINKSISYVLHINKHLYTIFTTK